MSAAKRGGTGFEPYRLCIWPWGWGALHASLVVLIGQVCGTREPYALSRYPWRVPSFSGLTFFFSYIHTPSSSLCL